MTPTQRKRFKKHARKAATDLCTIIIENLNELIELAEHRATEIGVHEYGDTSYHLPDERLETETWCELADAIFYQHIRNSK